MFVLSLIHQIWLFKQFLFRIFAYFIKLILYVCRKTAITLSLSVFWHFRIWRQRGCCSIIWWSYRGKSIFIINICNAAVKCEQTHIFNPPQTAAIITAIDLRQTFLFAVAVTPKLTCILSVSINARLNYDSDTASSLEQKLFENIFCKNISVWTSSMLYLYHVSKLPCGLATL
jgi:hypothetical protein